jgi:MFS family permease
MAHASYEAQVRQNHRWNYWTLLVDTASFAAISKILNPSITLTYYLSFFTDAKLLFALIPAILTIGSMVSQLFWANYVNGLVNKKRAWVIGTVISRSAMLLFLAGSAFTASQGGALPIWAFFGALLVYALANGLITPLWSNFVAKTFPRGFGRFLGLAYFVDGTVGIVGAYGMKYVLKTFPFPVSFTYFFLILAVFALLTILPVALFREVPYPVAVKSTPIWQTLSQIPALIRNYPSYGRYLACRVVVTFAEMSGAFYTVHALQDMGAKAEHVVNYTILITMGGLLANFVWGFIGDKIGFIRVFQLAFVIGLINNVLVLSATSPAGLYPVFFLQGVYIQAITMAIINLNVATSPGEQTTMFVGIANAITGPFLGLTPLLGALISRLVGFNGLLYACIAVYVVDIFLASWASRGALYAGLKTNQHTGG